MVLSVARSAGVRSIESVTNDQEADDLAAREVESSQLDGNWVV